MLTNKIYSDVHAQRTRELIILKNKIPSMVITYLVVSAIACVMAIFRTYHAQSIRFSFYIWNLLLAWIPFVCGVFIFCRYVSEGSYKRWSFSLLLALFIWIIFYPNAPYIVTDFIHINVYNYAYKVKDSLDFAYNFWAWYDFILISLFAWIGFMLGFVSLYLNQFVIQQKYGSFKCWIFVIIICIISGYGIYLGRFIRWNSWDIILNPLSLLNNIVKDFRLESVAFSCIFGLFLFLAYLLMYRTIRMNTNI